MEVVRHGPAEQPALITTAPENSGDDYERRKKKYAIMMGSRAVCVLAAALTYRVSLILALSFVVAGIVLPWCAVLIANDRPARKRQADLRYVARTDERALPAGRDDRTVEL